MTNRIFLDTEFYEDGTTIQLISIGLVKENGEAYYAETVKAWKLVRESEWLYDNVRPGLSLEPGFAKGRYQMANEIVEFCGSNPEFWAWYASYDWVVLCQLFGAMIDLPKGWPMYIHDFKQECDMRPWIPEVQIANDQEHNALADAKWLRQQFMIYQTADHE